VLRRAATPHREDAKSVERGRTATDQRREDVKSAERGRIVRDPREDAKSVERGRTATAPRRADVKSVECGLTAKQRREDVKSAERSRIARGRRGDASLGARLAVGSAGSARPILEREIEVTAVGRVARSTMPVTDRAPSFRKEEIGPPCISPTTATCSS
jgi:hypothetical protein